QRCRRGGAHAHHVRAVLGPLRVPLPQHRARGYADDGAVRGPAMTGRVVLLVGLLSLAAGGAATAAGGASPSRQPTGAPPGPPDPVARIRAHHLPNVTLITHQGRRVRFYDDLVKGKVVAINFMFTRCGQFCPITTANLAQVQAALGARVGRDVFLYSITLDP